MGSPALPFARSVMMGHVEVCDDSLAFALPPIKAGDVLDFEAGCRPSQGELAVMIVGSDVLVRYYYLASGGLVRLEAKNLSFPPLWKRRNEVYILGRVISHPQPHIVYREGGRLT